MTTKLSQTDKRAAFIAATNTFANADARWQQRVCQGMTDGELAEALRHELGIAGGRSATNTCPSIAYQGAGLKIWAGWQSFNYCGKQPVFEGKSTIAMARETYGINDPSDNQLDLF